MTTENDDQKAFWERFSEVWVARQSDLDGLMQPVLDQVMQRAGLRPGQQVLDIGCGTGTSTFLAAKAVGGGGRVLGADISAPMVARARATTGAAGNVAFLVADVANHRFEPALFDAAISRFGVMFFVDPVKAFVNIRRALKPGARITMAAWSVLDRNPWFRVPMYAAKARLGAPPPVDPDAPGPLAFRDIERVVGILSAAGFDKPQGEPFALMLTPPGTLQDAAWHAASIGPAARTMEYFEGSEDDFAAISASVVQAFEDYATPEGVKVPAEINFFSATAP